MTTSPAEVTTSPGDRIMMARRRREKMRFLNTKNVIYKGENAVSAFFSRLRRAKNGVFSHYDGIEFWRIFPPGAVPPLVFRPKGPEGGTAACISPDKNTLSLLPAAGGTFYGFSPKTQRVSSINFRT